MHFAYHLIPIAFIAFLTGLHLEASAPNAPQWSWQQPHATIVPTGDLQWAPQPFEFKAGDSKRYIDFESGDDNNNGLTPQTPWKHHPWDPKVDGEAKYCRGPHTYLFKQGVVYRGELNCNESGAEATPIILTRDPSWGSGPVVICGSEAVIGWKLLGNHPLIPEPDKVWYVDLDWVPRNVWMIGKDNSVSRIALARTPNWIIRDPDDIKSEWWTWKNPDKPFDNYTTVNGQRRHLAFDQDHINISHPQDYYEGAIVWTTKGWVMGNPFPSRVLAVDREKGALTFAGQWGGEPVYKIIRGCQYYLEDKPHYLDSPGEFWFDKQGSGGRLYLRLPEDQDPNQVQVEVARRIRMIDSRGMSHVSIRGLTFRFPNVYWNLVAAPYWVSRESIDVQPGCIRLLGSGANLEISHCVFEHVHKGIRMKAMGPDDAIDQVTITDNRFSHADSGGVEVADGTTYHDASPRIGRLYDVEILRNQFEHIGLRPDLFGQGVALAVQFAQTAEIAGNIFYRICAQGIDVHGSKASEATTDRPFTRILVHHNKAVDTLINVDDFGGIETWQGGPAYVYNNISGNPGGYRNWDHVLSPDTEDRFGHAYYLDGAFKNYYFNNIAWGKSKGPSGKLANTAAFQQIISYENTFFHNTLYNFVRGSRRQAPQAGRVKFLGNIWQSMGERVFRDADPARTAQAGNEADAGPRRNEYALDTVAYARNVFCDIGSSFAVFEPSGKWHQTLPQFRDALQKYRPLAAEVGLMAAEAPLCDASAHDFRPSKDSADRGSGVKVFVPWSLYETVAEWHFCPIPGDPTRILDEHWCMSPYYTRRDDYYKWPTYPLRGVNITLTNYLEGPLENWTTGALYFNGIDQFAVLRHEDLADSITLQAQGRSGSVKRTISGPEISDPQIHTSNFLIEAYFKTAPDQTDMVLLQKTDFNGYVLGVNGEGGVTLAATSDAATAWLASRKAVNDGQWHHLVAEADRKAGTFTIYLDGQSDAHGKGLGTNASLANVADLYVGGAPNGYYWKGEIDFLRIARGTLADSKTTIEELYAWEFNGPHLSDFNGQRRPDKGGYAGAIEGEIGSPANAAVPSHDPEFTLRIATVQCGQDHFARGNPGPEANFAALASQARSAAQQHPDLIMFPEYALSGWPYPAESVINGLAETVPGPGPWFKHYQALARDIRTPLVGWLVETEAGQLYNCAFLLDADGSFIGKYRKVHANLGEQTWWGWSQGNAFQPIEFRGVRYGFSICSDMWYPETMRCQALLGADVILHLSIADDMTHLVPARATDNYLPVVMSIFQGGCYAVDHRGHSLGKLGAGQPAWKIFNIKPFARSIGQKYGGTWDERAGYFSVRNPDAYGALVDATARPPWTKVFLNQEGQPQTRDEILQRFGGRYDAKDPDTLRAPIIRFNPPWTSPFRADPDAPHQLINQEGAHLLILNKTAWAYFGCQDPGGYLDRARDQSVNVIRVALEGRPYWKDLGIELWPWGGSRTEPDWNTFNESYWQRVEERVRLAGEKGIGLDVVLYFSLHPESNDISTQRRYWQECLRRLGKYANILTWEITNEYTSNETFQDAAGQFFKQQDPHGRPVCTSDGTTDDAVWPGKPWMDLAINHSCTSSRHDLGDWYLAVARNTRSHGKPAWCNESGREGRHQNDDGIHRRKQGWLWYAAGCFWTWHSWDGCEGINDRTYRAPGEEFLRPMANVFRRLPFWRMHPNQTTATIKNASLVQATLASASRDHVLIYGCTRESQQTVSGAYLALRLSDGAYRLTFLKPQDGSPIEIRPHHSKGLAQESQIPLPPFVDDLAVQIERL